MSQEKYIGLDVHQASISAAVMDPSGNVLMECLLETKLGRSYLTVSKEITRTMNRIKSLYRSCAIPCSGATVYAPRHRGEWLAKIMEPGVRVRAQHLYQQLDNLQPLRLEARP